MIERKPNHSKNLIYVILVVALVIGMFFIYRGTNFKMQEKLYTEFEAMVENNEVAYVYAEGTVVYFLTNDALNTIENKDDAKETFFKNQSNAEYFAESPSYIIVQELITRHNLENNSIKVEGMYSPAKQSWISSIMPYLSIGLLVVVAFIIIKSINQVNNKNIGFGKTKSKNVTMSKVRFNDVAGADEEKEELKEIVEFLKNPQKFTDLGARVPKGVLLVGPPGTGKTLLAKAVAGESKAPFYSISGSDFVEMFVGVGASRVRDLFDKAKSTMPSIIFIDEIDAVGRQRGAGLGGGNDEREQTLNQLLVELDGFEANDGIVVIAATNRPDVLDPALLRPGRFDRQIYVNLPDVKGREEILKVHSKNKHLASDVNLSVIAKITIGFSGADLANLLNEAAILTGRDDRQKITMLDITEAIDKVIMGPQKRSHVITEKDKKITAYHESGHAIIHKVLPDCDEVHEVSIIPRGMAGGYTMSRPQNDDSYATYNKLISNVKAFMGGRIAEELVFNDISTGASNDIEQATKIVKNMVTKYGMSSKLGFINLGSTSEVFIGRDYKSQASFSEKTSSEIDDEIKRILKECYEETKEILKANMDKLNTMATLLLEKETIYTEEVEMIMNNTPLDEIRAHLDQKALEDKKRIEKEKEELKQEQEKRNRTIQERTIQELAKEGIHISIKTVDNKQSTENENKETTKIENKDSVENNEKESKNENKNHNEDSNQNFNQNENKINETTENLEDTEKKESSTSDKDINKDKE